MSVRRIAQLALIAIAFSGAAVAQVPRGYTPQSGEARALEENKALSAAQFQRGVEALQSKNFTVAEGIFDEILRSNPAHPDANFLMGVTKMSLAKWEDAKRYLTTATEKKPKEPDPKSRLGVTLIKLGDSPGAMAQREALLKMEKDCKGTCKNAKYIGDGIAMIDQAMTDQALFKKP